MVAHAHANAEFGRFDADWYGTDDPIATAPWLFDAGGNPIEVPADALGFRVRYLPPGSRGMGELLIDEVTGVPLFVPRGCGPEEFCALVLHRPGRYRLALIDERYQFLRHAPVACFLLTPAMAAAHHASAPAAAAAAAAPPPPAVAPSPHADPLVLQLVEILRTQSQAPSHADPLVLQLVEALRGALTDARGALTETLGVIRAQNADGGRNLSELVRASATVVTAADGAGISRRDPLPVPPPMVVDASATAVGEDGGGPPNIGDVLGGALSNLAPVMQHFMNTKLFKMSEETSLAMLKAMQGAMPGGPPPSSQNPAGAINPAALWPHVAAIEQLLSSDEAAVVRRYLSHAGGEQVGQLAREVMARSAADAAAWIRALLADVERTQSPPHRTAEAARTDMDTQHPPGEPR